MNMLIGVICEVMGSVAAFEKEAMITAYLKRELPAILEEGDLEGDGRISRQEFLLLMRNKQANAAFLKVGVDTKAMIEFSDSFFQSDDRSQEFERLLTHDEFISLSLKFRGSNVATVRDIIDLKCFIHKQVAVQNLQVARVEARVKALDEAMAQAP